MSLSMTLNWLKDIFYISTLNPIAHTNAKEKEKEEVAIKDLGDSVHKSDVQIKY